MAFLSTFSIHSKGKVKSEATSPVQPGTLRFTPQKNLAHKHGKLFYASKLI